ncbi:transporter substrate-binding domain-containing protein [Agrobacterium tumefaciens]|uniref:transporter substrate-binding domain-containing protein n=1 Tax=Agrobacterium tumefaciens TaxID=358 RepID=UPI002201FB46|nr:transporter substrate-binding domain-containing protein [Agrobacterium tumefaciens]
MKFVTKLRLLAVAATATLGAITVPAQADDLAAIKAAGVINVGIFPDFPPFASVSADMSTVGYDVDVANSIAKAIGVKVNLVSVNGQNRIAFLNDKRIDMLLSVGYSDERAKAINFVAPYAPYYIAVMGPQATKVAGPEDLASKSIAVNQGTLEDTSLTKAAPESATIRRFPNYNAVIQAFITGQTDLMAVGNNVGAQVLERQTSLKPEEKFQLMSSPSHIAVRQGEDALKGIIADALKTMTDDGSLNAASEKWLKTPLKPENLKRVQ